MSHDNVFIVKNDWLIIYGYTGCMQKIESKLNTVLINIVLWN